MAEEKGLSLEMMSKLEEVFEQTDIEGIKQAREVLRKAEKKKYPDKGIVLRSRLPKKHTEQLKVVIEYMYTHKYIEKNTIYNFVKFSCEQVMDQMLPVIRENQIKSRTP